MVPDTFFCPMKACGGSTQAPYEARYIEHSEFLIFFFQDDARRISQYSCLTLFSIGLTPFPIG